MNVYSIALVLFLIMDPVGNIASFIKMLEKYDARRQKLIIFREMLIALVAMIVFAFFGKFFITVLEISETTVRISSGVILFLVALKILFPGVTSLRANLPTEEPFVIPLAIPLIAGPALLATVMLYANLVPNKYMMLGAIFLSWICSTAVLLVGPQLKKVLRNNGLIALEKLMGMVLILLAVQRFLDGIYSFLTVYHG